MSPTETTNKLRPLVLQTINEVGDYERALGWLRYEAMSKLSPWKVSELHLECITDDVSFDVLIDQLIYQSQL